MKTLGLDLGTNSLGWAVIETRGEPAADEEGRILASGARIFSQSEMAGRDPQSKASLAVARRQARGTRRRRDRYVKRRQLLLGLLVEVGLMPAEERHARRSFATMRTARRATFPLPSMLCVRGRSMTHFHLLKSVARSFISTSGAGSRAIGKPTATMPSRG